MKLSLSELIVWIIIIIIIKINIIIVIKIKFEIHNNIIIGKIRFSFIISINI